jgi:hypothetical protein
VETSAPAPAAQRRAVSRMSANLDRARRYHDGIRGILLREWDPIGVADIAEAQDEYDSYVSKIHGMLIRHEPRHKLVDHLWWIETQNMGLAGNRLRTEAIADRLLGLRDELEGSR